MIKFIPGWWFQPTPTPLKNDGVRQLGLLFPTEWKNKIHVPNNQPDPDSLFY
jgi:hypothetical protein